MLTKIIRNFLLMSFFLSGVNAIAIGEAVVITNEVQAEQRQVLVFKELKPEPFIKNCIEYSSDFRSFQVSDIISSSQNNPFRRVENCLLQAMNKSLKPVCDEERSLKAALRKDQHDDETWEEIEKTLVYLEEVKYEYADTLYEVADGIDELGVVAYKG